MNQIVFRPYQPPDTTQPGATTAAAATSPWIYAGIAAAVAAAGGVAYYALRAKKNPACEQGRCAEKRSARFDTVLQAARHGDSIYGKGNYVVKFGQEGRRNPTRLPGGSWSKHDLVGKRVELPAWARFEPGDRYAVITGALHSGKSGKVMVSVRHEGSNRRDRFYLDDLKMA